ncbi:hypothetical protein BBOV_II005130 [Babesia bovis T2Bo]|uniref:CCAAT-binding factor domain-containing protein n=1 Tax=Babesia bovis TaxID=5865 RepID=A7AU54_BABBO|nr:hypothetical protein BBOV_II005130 [Babesia bovis T2Bo]EDO06465.1 hypothetical protein BBOV_II005130 [Babesia bovis T2Bo]|eukprot:XP_001610033.1 hypothetical protein [Babesia bovis T2Bo]
MTEDKNEVKSKPKNWYDAMVTLNQTTSLNVVLKLVDYLIEEIYIAKAEFPCYYDRQFFTDVQHHANTLHMLTGKSLDNKKTLRILCLNFVATIAKLCQRKGYTIAILPHLFTIIRLESKLLQLLQSDHSAKFKLSQVFPGCFLEFTLGLVIYNDEWEIDAVFDILSNYVNTPEIVYHCYVALQNIQESLESDQAEIYKHDNVTDVVALERLTELVLRLPKPELTYQKKKEDARKAKASTIKSVINYDSDSGSSIEYSESSENSESESSDETADDESDESYSDIDVNGDENLNHESLKAYSSMWQGIILCDIAMNKDITAKILNRMPADILPYTRSPLIYANWLIDHLNSKDNLLSMLSLKGIFDLVLNHGLGEVEELNNNMDGKQVSSSIYERIYMYLSDNIIASEYGRDFLQFVNLALKSVKLPSQLTARFIKKLVRTACFTECFEATILLTIAVNLLKVHSHTCLGVIHQDDVANIQQTIDKTSMESLMETSDKNETEQEQIYIWELPLMINHFNERTAIMASTFYSDLKKKRAVVLKPEDIIDCDSIEHLRLEIKKARREEKTTFRSTLQQTTQLAKQLFA